MKRLIPFDTAQDIADALRSEDPQTRQDAIDFVFPDRTAALISVSREVTQCATTGKVDVAPLFSGLLFFQQNLGKMLGLELNWHRDPAATSKKLMIAPSGAFS